MRLKTYFSTSVEAAMILALEQMGPEAMIVNSRKTAPEHRYLGEYEVVFATALECETDPETAAGSPSESGSLDKARQQQSEVETEAVKRLHSEVSRLASEIESLGRVMKRTEAKQAVSKFEGEQADLAQALSETGFDEEFIQAAIADVAEGTGSLRFRLLQYLMDRLKAAPSLGRIGQGRKVAALVGPAGAGKSALIAKLAMRFGVASKRPCQIVSLDSDRIGAAEPLRLVAGVLGVGFRQIEDPESLGSTLDSLRDRDLVLVDTPGFSRDEGDLLDRLARSFSSREEIDVHLVLPASMKPRDLDRAIKFYGPLNPVKLLFTRLDETDQLGTAIQMAIRVDRPISFLSAGPRIPEDIEPANAAQLARRVLLPVANGFVRRAAA